MLEWNVVSALSGAPCGNYIPGKSHLRNITGISVEGGFVIRISTLVFVLLLSAAWLQAQQYPQTGSSQSGSSASAQASTVQGCLQGSNGNFTLTDNAGHISDPRGYL